MTRIFDIDLDVFVTPPAFERGKNDPRLSPDEHAVPSISEIQNILERWRISAETPLRLLENHEEILNAVSELIESGVITLPICWVHIDAHDDFWGHHSRAPDFHNFMYEVVRRKWAGVIAWIYPDGCYQFPAYILDQAKQEIAFSGFRVPVRFETLDEFRPFKGPDIAFLTRSPAFTPPTADLIYDYIRAHTKTI